MNKRWKRTNERKVWMMFQMKNGWIVTALNLVKNIKFGELVNERTCTRTVTVIFGSHEINSFRTHAHVWNNNVHSECTIKCELSLKKMYSWIVNFVRITYLNVFLGDLQNDHFKWIYFFCIKTKWLSISLKEMEMEMKFSLI